MKKTAIKKSLSVLLCLMLAASMAFFAGCGGDNAAETTTEPVSINESDNGYEKSFIFEVVDKDGNKTQTTIETNGKYVGEVLQELELIKGEEGPYGLYIKTVKGITADYEVDGTYWAFYINGEMAQTGVDLTEITDGATYSFRVE